MKTYVKQAAFVLAVIAVAKLVKGNLPVPPAIGNLLP